MPGFVAAWQMARLVRCGSMLSHLSLASSAWQFDDPRPPTKLGALVNELVKRHNLCGSCLFVLRTRAEALLLLPGAPNNTGAGPKSIRVELDLVAPQLFARTRRDL